MHLPRGRPRPGHASPWRNDKTSRISGLLGPISMRSLALRSWGPPAACPMPPHGGMTKPAVSRVCLARFRCGHLRCGRGDLPHLIQPSTHHHLTHTDRLAHVTRHRRAPAGQLTLVFGRTVPPACGFASRRGGYVHSPGSVFPRRRPYRARPSSPVCPSCPTTGPAARSAAVAVCSEPHRSSNQRLAPGDMMFLKPSPEPSKAPCGRT